jgi:hypothetical protein
MPEFIIHLGPHKTGTTYLQLSFRARRAALAERGIIFPEAWELAPGNPSHLPLAQWLKAGAVDRLAPEFAALLASGAKQVLISSEDLSTLEPEAVALLRTLLAGSKVRFVFYFRRWSELLPSSWQESIKQGQSWTLPEYTLLTVQNVRHSKLLNFDRKLAPFRDAFGAGSLRLCSYSELREREMDLFQHFAAQFLDWPDAPAGDAPANANASRDLATSEILRVLNSRVLRGGPASDRMRRAFDLLPDRSFLAPVVDAIHAHSRKMRFSDAWPSLLALHDELVESYHAHMIQPKRNRLLFRLRNAELSYSGPEYLLEPGVVEILRDLQARLQPAAAA